MIIFSLKASQTKYNILLHNFFKYVKVIKKAILRVEFLIIFLFTYCYLSTVMFLILLYILLTNISFQLQGH